jgi:CSLREA domain-containing protein
MAMALALGVLASPLQAITVTATHDAVDADLGDGACGDSTGQCTLRAAIQHANVTPGPDVIVLTPGYYLLSIPGESEDDGAEGDLDITDSVGLVGLPGQGTTIDGNGLDRVFDIFNGAEAIITDLIVTGGGSGAPGGTEGGGIYINDGELDLRNSQVTGNTGRRAGIEASFTTSVKIEDSVISHNRAVSGTNVYRTAGIYVGSPLGEVTIKRSTIARNVCGAGTSACDSGVVFQFCDPWTPHLENVTIAENTAGVTTHACNLSIENGTLVGSTDESGLNFGTTEGWETVTVTNTILAHNWKDCRADDLNIAGGGNLDSDDSLRPEPDGWRLASHRTTAPPVGFLQIRHARTPS